MLKNIFLIVAMLFATQAVAGFGDYKTLDQSFFTVAGKTQRAVGYGSKNIINSAFVAVDGTVNINSSQFVPAMQNVFNTLENDPYRQDLVVSGDFKKAIEKAISDFVCKEYNYRRNRGIIDHCDSYVRKNGPKQPFLFLNEGTDINISYEGEKVIYYVKSIPREIWTAYTSKGKVDTSKDKDFRTSFWFPVHELGMYAARYSNKSEDLLLNLMVSAYYKETNGKRGSAIITNQYAAYILPSHGKIESFGSAAQAVKYSLGYAKVLHFKPRKK